MPTAKRILHVISTTHWDREWLKAFQENRALLVEYLERLMDTFDRDPDYRHYHMDSQCVPLEDYTAVRPENAERLKGHIRDGRLLVGPWYTLPEMNVLDGESIVRNLLIGHKVSRAFGGVMKVGYNPMSSGQVSQLPQIYRGFGIDSALFYRGINRDVADIEFWWNAPDGSRVLGVQFPEGRGVFWGLVEMPVLYGARKGPDGIFPYRPGMGAQHFRMHGDAEYTLLTRLGAYDGSALAEGLTAARDRMIVATHTRHLIAVDGHDQSPAFEDLPRLIREANALDLGVRLVHDNLPRAVAAIRREAEDCRGLRTLTGEMRYTNKSGRPGEAYLHVGVLSARMYLKQANRRSERALFRWAEPTATIAWTLGEEYPHRLLEQACKLLLLNHAHDDICGCSVDKVHEDMMYRFSEIDAISEEVTRRSLKALVRRIDGAAFDGRADLLVAHNSLAFGRREVVRAVVDLPPEAKASAFALQDAGGREARVQVIGAADKHYWAPYEGASLGYPRRRVECYVQADVPAMGFSAMQVLPGERSKAGKPLAASDRKMENEHLRVGVNADGTFDLTDKAAGRTFAGLHWLEDRGEDGNAWTARPPRRDRVVTSRGGRCRTTLLLSGPLVAKIEVRVRLRLPTALTADRTARQKRTRTVEVASVLTLRAGAKRLEIETRFDNTVRSHCLRALFPTRLKTDTSLGSMPFDVCERPVALPEDADQWQDRPVPEQPCIHFAAASDGRAGLALLPDGLTEYELVDGADRTLALTLLRTFDQGLFWTPEKWPDEGFQCPGPVAFRYAVYPFAGAWEQAGLFEQALAFQVPIRTVQCGRPGGKPGKHALPARTSFLSVEPSRVVVSAVKRSESGREMLVRLFNPAGRAVSARLRTHKPIRAARLLTLEEEPVEKLSPAGRELELKVPAKAIRTVAIARRR